MERGLLGTGGLGLVALGLAGLILHASPWLAWLVATVGAGSLLAAGAAIGIGMRSRRSAWGWSLAIAVALWVLWAIAEAVGATGWLAWWTLGFGAGYLALGLMLGLAVAVRGLAAARLAPRKAVSRKDPPCDGSPTTRSGS